MGGAVAVPGNVAGSPDAPSENTTAEWNIYADPTAAQIVLGADVQVFLISLDGTSKVPVTSAFVDRVIPDATGTGLEILAELFGKNPYMTGGDYYLWDPLAAIAAAGYPIGEFTSVHLTVDESDGPTSGATQRTDGAPNANYLSAVDAHLVEDLMIWISTPSERVERSDSDPTLAWPSPERYAVLHDLSGQACHPICHTF